MFTFFNSHMTSRPYIAAFFALAVSFGSSFSAEARTRSFIVSPFAQTLAQQVSDNEPLARFYQQAAFEPLWTGDGALYQQRRDALIAAIDLAEAHGLPVERYKIGSILDQLAAVRNEEDRSAAEVALSGLLVRLSQDLKFGILNPRKVIPAYKREIPSATEMDYLGKFASQDPNQYFRDLLPRSDQYVRLFEVRQRLLAAQKTGGFGPTIQAGILNPGTSGAEVTALKNRLISLGYMQPSATETYNRDVIDAVKKFQAGHGLAADGVAGPATLAVLNRSVSDRMRAVLVAMERERWFNRDLGATYVLVNLTDFTAKLIVNDREVFETRSVIGKTEPDQQTPEFSDMMEYMVINPQWNVPRSITVNEYLPRLQRNRNAVGHLDVYNRRGQKISRDAVNFSAYNAKTFPYVLKQSPSARNALGRVKFMFPNRYNIYLHDTPSKDLFSRRTRAYSHGCVRLHKPFDFAQALLSLQDASPAATFKRYLDSGKERTIGLKNPIPVHLIYRTTYVNEHGKLEFYGDIYGRDKQIWAALERAGVHTELAGG